nr:hypothetical protein [uncultured Allomuricauda sp.]
MNVDILKIDCKKDIPLTKRKTDFYCCKFSFNPETNKYDKFILNELKKKGKELADLVNHGAANDSAKNRNYTRVLTNSVAGMIAEYLWKTYLNLSNIDHLVTETELDDLANQIDLKTIKNEVTIEVRSSFPRNGLVFAICNPEYQFDIIGPYSNNYKSGEQTKDIYCRTLFPFDFNEFNQRIDKNNFEVFLTGGATKEMFLNDKITKEKSFIPDDEVSIERLSSKSDYLVIPFEYALDSIEIFKKIKEANNED